MNSNVASKYNYIIAKELISSGSPTRYQLKPKKRSIGTLKRMTLGEKDPDKSNKTILLVGETGAGKSTLINALVNFALGVEFDDNIWFEIVEQDNKSELQSQTSDVIVYEIFGFEDKNLPYSLTIIDTPGYGSTSGIEHDVIVSQRLLDLFRSDDGVQEINVVGLVMKAQESRLSDRLSYIFNSVVSLFGNDVEENIVALVTHSNGRTPKNALKALEASNIKCAKNKKNEPVHFVFDNCQNEDRTEEIEDLKHSESVTMRGMNGFTAFLGKAAPQKLEKTVRVLNERIRLTACVQNLLEQVEETELKQQEIQQTEKALKTYEQKMKENEEFTVEIDVPCKKKEPIPSRKILVFFKGAVCCKSCEENCHYPGCTLALDPSWCEVMKDNRCTVCTNKCPVSAHVKENWRFVNGTRKVKQTLSDVKEKFDSNKAETEKTRSLLEALQTELKKLEDKKTQLVDQTYEHILTLEKIALSVYSLSTYVDLDILIKKMEEKKENAEKIKKLKQMAHGTYNEALQTGLRYIYSKFTNKLNIKGGSKTGTMV